MKTKYGYAVGRIRALETRLLSTYKIARMVEASNCDELIKLLQDTHYANWLPTSPSEYENMIKAARDWLFNLMEKLILEKNLIEAIKLKYDYHNAKVLIKASIGEKAAENLLLPYGNINLSEIKQIFSEEKYYKLNYLLSDGISETISNYYLTKEARLIDITLDKYYYLALLNLIDCEFYKNIIKRKIDLTNIKTLIRIKWVKEERSLLEKAIISGGNIESSTIISAFAEPIEVMPRYFSMYAKIIQDGIEYLQTNNSFIKLESIFDSYLINEWRKTKYITFGVEPILAYFYFCDNEFIILRIIFVGKLYNVSEKLIRDRLPETYYG